MSESKELPADVDLVTQYDFDAPAMSTSSRDNVLTIHHKKVQFEIGEDPIGDRIGLVFIARRYFRVLYAREYEELGENDENIIVCRSADGWNGRGLGRKPTAPELQTGAWRGGIQDRPCMDPHTQERLCPSAGGKKLKDWICRPKIRALVMVSSVSPDGATSWVPAFFEVGGTAFRDCEGAFRTVMKRMLLSRAKDHTGKTIVRQPLWTWAFLVELTEKRGRAQCDVTWRGPKEVSAQSLKEIDAWARKPDGGPALWGADKAAADLMVSTVGELPEEDEPTNEPEPVFGGEVPEDNTGGWPVGGPGEADPDDFDRVPF